MRAGTIALTAALLAPPILLLTSCGGGSKGSNTPPGTNNQLAVSTAGLAGSGYTNGLFASVTVCVAGSTNCQTVNNVLVDTGSFGLRLLGSQLNLPLAQAKDSNGDPVDECQAFVSSFNWGPVAIADVQIAGEKAANVPIQIMGGFSGQAPPAVPASCSSGGLTETDTQATLGANGVLGIGVFAHDCGTACAPGATSTPPIYFGCPSSGCSAVLLPEQDQVQNPVTLFAQDNNGEIVSLPQISGSGAQSANGQITFGLGTQSDNGVPNSVTLLAADGTGSFATTYPATGSNSVTYPGSILDSGSNANFFLDASLSGLSDCTSNSASGFYCPASTTSETATNSSASGTGSTASVAANWNVANAEQLFSTSDYAFNDLGGPNPGAFDFGLSFFYGRSIYVGINSASSGPFFGY
jgi:hypothetical protein